MSYSFTNNESFSFTISNARQLASKIATDLRIMYRFYGKPSIDRITDFEEEITLLVKAGYLEKVYFGFQRNGEWVTPTLIYTASEIDNLNSIDDDPGRIPLNEDVESAIFKSYLFHSESWFDLSAEERRKFEETLPFKRVGAAEPGVNGRIVQDKTYSSGGKSLIRSSIKN